MRERGPIARASSPRDSRESLRGGLILSALLIGVLVAASYPLAALVAGVGAVTLVASFQLGRWFADGGQGRSKRVCLPRVGVCIEF